MDSIFGGPTKPEEGDGKTGRTDHSEVEAFFGGKFPSIAGFDGVGDYGFEDCAGEDAHEGEAEEGADAEADEC